MEDKVIQTIVMRRLYPDGDNKTKRLTSGKYCSQAAHGSMAFLSNKFRNSVKNKISGIDYFEEYIDIPQELSEEEKLWIQDSFTKICLCVDSEEELLDIHEKAKSLGLTVNLITDSGLTEFNGVKTITCLAIGPHFKSSINQVTKDLRLF